MLLVLLENGEKFFFHPKGSHIIIKKEELNIARVPDKFSVFSFFQVQWLLTSFDGIFQDSCCNS